MVSTEEPGRPYTHLYAAEQRKWPVHRPLHPVARHLGEALERGGEAAALRGLAAGQAGGCLSLLLGEGESQRERALRCLDMRGGQAVQAGRSAPV